MSAVFERIFELLDEDGVKPHKQRRYMADITGISFQGVSKWFSGDTKKIDQETLSRIANHFGVRYEWLAFGRGSKKETAEIHDFSASRAESEGVVVISKWQAQFGQGAGVPAEFNHDEIIGALEVTEDWAQKYLGKASDYKNVGMVTGLGDSMEPTYYDGETLFIDTGHADFNLDTVYAFCLHGEFYIKRIQRRKGKYFAISDNKKYAEWEIEPDDFEHLHVYGRIIKGARIFDV